MKNLTGIVVFLFIISSTLYGQKDLPGFESNWAQWRGPYDTGVAPSGNPPLKWSETTNIKWKSEIPGIGHATPIIWKDQIILLSAVKTDQKDEADTPPSRKNRSKSDD